MSHSLWGFAATLVMAVVLFSWGLYAVLRSAMGKEKKTLDRRWKSLSAGQAPQPVPAFHAQQVLSQSVWLDTFLRWLPGRRTWTRYLSQTGLPLSVANAWLMALALPLGMGGAGLLLGLGRGWISWLMGLGLAGPVWFLQHKRRQRIARIEAHLPDVLDLIARAMQAGHAFTSALLMAANDAKPPLSDELHKVFDEINFGLDLRQAMSGLTERVASDDLRFFVVSVLIQHETGGNLAEVLKNTASLIRERQKIRGVIRVLSGEGRISAWILSLLPFALAAALNLINPGFISTLWTHPLGLQMLYTCLMLMLIGIIWMWHLIDIRI